MSTILIITVLLLLFGGGGGGGYYGYSRYGTSGLGRVDKRDSHGALIVIQAGICDGDQLGTRPDVGRRVGVS